MKKKLIVIAATLVFIVLAVVVSMVILKPEQVSEFETITSQDVFSDYPAAQIPFPVPDKSAIGAIGVFKDLGDVPGQGFHNGFDFMTTRDNVEFIAIGDGTVSSVEIFKDENRPGAHPQINIQVAGSDNWGYIYAFEPFGTDNSSAEKQMSMLSVKKGDKISTGQKIGSLHRVNDGAHVHVSIMKNDTHSCYQHLFSEEDRQFMLSLARLAVGTTERKLCYF